MRRLLVVVVSAVVFLGGCGGTGKPEGAVSERALASSALLAGSDCRRSSLGALLELDGGGVYFGVNLDWDHDSIASLASRLGRSSALYVAFVQFFMEGAGASFVDFVVVGLVGQWQALMLILEFGSGFAIVTDSVVVDLAIRLAGYNRDGVAVFLRFVHEMNGFWYSWSQQPAAYVAAFRKVAAAVH